MTSQPKGSRAKIEELKTKLAEANDRYHKAKYQWKQREGSLLSKNEDLIERYNEFRLRINSLQEELTKLQRTLSQTRASHKRVVTRLRTIAEKLRNKVRYQTSNIKALKRRHEAKLNNHITLRQRFASKQLEKQSDKYELKLKAKRRRINAYRCRIYYRNNKIKNKDKIIQYARQSRSKLRRQRERWRNDFRETRLELRRSASKHQTKIKKLNTEIENLKQLLKEAKVGNRKTKVVTETLIAEKEVIPDSIKNLSESLERVGNLAKKELTLIQTLLRTNEFLEDNLTTLRELQLLLWCNKLKSGKMDEEPFKQHNKSMMKLVEREYLNKEFRRMDFNITRKGEKFIDSYLEHVGKSSNFVKQLIG